MIRPLRPLPELLATSLVAALAAARWEVADLASRRPGELVPGLLSGRAAELAMAPVAADQLLSLALDAAANDLTAGRAPLEEGVLAFFSRLDADEVVEGTEFDGPDDGRRFIEDLHLVAELEARHRGLGFSGAELSARLAEDAQLQALLAGDARIPADAAIRRLMRASVEPLLERSHALDPNVVRDVTRRARRGELPFRAAEADIELLRRPPILLSEADHECLTALAFDILLSDPRAAAPLLQEVQRARVVPDDELPADVVRLGASVEFAELFAGRIDRVKLVGERQEREPGSLSVVTSTGCALIGLSVGQSILWTDHFGCERLVTVTDVRFEPGCAGRLAPPTARRAAAVQPNKEVLS
jgi:regulator of nucleoside diphosphate kinase